MVAQQTMTGGYVVTVDDDDAHLLEHRWSPLRTRGLVYAQRSVCIDGKRRTLLLHREVLGTDAPEVDHIDRNPLNNRRSNLRPATRGLNRANSRPYRNNTTGYRGVSRQDLGYRATISIDGTKRYLGSSIYPEECARMYDAAARQAFGEFATLNFPDDQR